MSIEEPPDGQPELEPRAEDSLQRAFARALNEELDRIGYPSPPARTNALSQDLGVSRMQAFRIGRGDSLPTIKTMLKLQNLGVALDAVLEQLQETKPESVTVEISGVTVQAVALPAAGRMPFVMTRRDDVWVLQQSEPSQPIRPGEVPVGGLRFAKPRPVVAVIEDDAATLKVFCSDLAKAFHAVPFRSDKAFMQALERTTTFDAVVLDWVLPHTDGGAVINRIRTHTRAPIVVTTGHREASPAISGVLGLPDLYYVAKPVEGDILRAMLSAAIEKASPQSASAATR